MAETNAPDPLGDVLSLLSTWGNNFTRNTSTAFSQLRTKDYIRLVVIIGAYCLFRPYLLKIAAKIQAKENEKAIKEEEERNPGTKLNANDLRGGKKVAIPGVDSDDDEEQEAAEGAADFGRKARLRQRKFIREKVEELEKRHAEEESDEEIREFLVD